MKTGAGFKRGKSKQNYATPPTFISAVRNRFGIDRFDIDLAADATNTKGGYFFSEAENSLSFPWNFPNKYLWLNPPFNDIRPWVEQASKAVCNYLFVLIPASVGINWYRDHVHGKAQVFFLNGRIPFDPDNPTWGFPKDCMLCVYGQRVVNVNCSVWDWRKDVLG